MKTFKKIIEELAKTGQTISTGGGVADAITSIEGASKVLKFSAVTYSNEFKIKMGVNPDIIDKYSVYSTKTAQEMALNISKFTNSDIGIGITGKLNKADENNNYGKDNEVFISIYYKHNYYNMNIIVDKKSRMANKLVIIDLIIEKLEELLWEEKLIK